MNKEYLEALERIDNTLCLNNIKGNIEFGIDTDKHEDCDSVIGMTDDLETIKQALQRLEAIDNSQPSKALECLERMCKVSRNKMDFNIGWVFEHEINTIKQTLLKAQEQEKVIDELKENVKRWHDTLKSKNKYASEMVVAEIEEYWAIKSGV